MRISDWSSDVCSSYLWADSALLTSRAAAPCLFHEELLAHIPTRGAGRPCRAALRRLFPDSAGGADHPRHPVQRRGGAGDRHALLDHLQRPRGPARALRASSDERRVGKECVSTCSSGRSLEHYIKKYLTL